jgi:WD40 repeat protein
MFQKAVLFTLIFLSILGLAMADAARDDINLSSLMPTGAVERRDEATTVKPDHLADDPRGRTLWLNSQKTRLAALAHGALMIWNTDTGELIADYQTGAISALAFSPDGKFIVCTTAEGAVRVWAVP